MPTFNHASSAWLPMLLAVAIGISPQQANNSHGQESANQASISSAIGNDGTGTIVVEARGQLPKPPVIYTAKAVGTAIVGLQRIEHVIELNVKVIQGDAKHLSFGLNGQGQVTAVVSENLLAWSVRQAEEERFLDLHLKENVTDAQALITLRSPDTLPDSPVTVEMSHLTPGDSIGFDSTVAIEYASGVQGVVEESVGFTPIDRNDGNNRFQTSTGGRLRLSLRRSGVSPAPVEFVDARLEGVVHPNGKSIAFQLRGTALVTDDDAEITILSGNAAVSEFPTDANYQLRLSNDDAVPAYKLLFKKAGTYPLELDFVAALVSPDTGGQLMDFTIAASAVVQMSISGLDAELDFHRDQQSVVPLRDKDEWVGFLPANGRARLQWKNARNAGDGKLFFSSTAQVEASVGAGLLRQDHKIQYRILQGELNSFQIMMRGPGEILDVQGDHLVAWKVSDRGDDRQLDVTLSQPIAGTSEINVRSQTTLDAFPVRVQGLCLNPIGAIRHSGFLRLTNSGSVRLEPTALSGLTQLAPEQFPGQNVEARQVFVYRFPAAEHDFTVVADRIEPEVNVSELLLYQLAESDRTITADIELDIREAPIREWNFEIPADYSVVSVTGANLADSIVSTQVAEGRRNLKVMFAQDVSGRQLMTLQLEKSEPAVAQSWVLPRLEYPDAKTVRGDLGIIGVPGFRIAVTETDLLVEKPLAYFPKPTPGLQQAFRIRERDWSATMQIELLERSVQSDVFHLYSLNQQTVYGSVLINFFVTGSPVSQWRITVPAELGNVMVDGQDIRTYRREDETLIVSLHQPVMGAYTLLVTFEEKPIGNQGSFQAGQIVPLDVQGDRGYIQVVSPMQVEISTASISDDLLRLDPLELPAEFRLLSTATPLGTWQYTQRPFDLSLNVRWFQPGTTATQVIEFSEANSRVSHDGELVTDVLYYVKSRGQRTLEIELPPDPLRLWEVSVDGQVVTARQADHLTLVPLPGGTDPNLPTEVRLRLGKPAVDDSYPKLTLPTVSAPILKTQWKITGDEKHLLVPFGGTVTVPSPVTRPSGFHWVAQRGILSLCLITLFTAIGIWARGESRFWRFLGLLSVAIAISVSVATVITAYDQIGSPESLQLSLPILSAGESIELNVQNMPLWQIDLSLPGAIAGLVGILALLGSFTGKAAMFQMISRSAGMFLIALGVLLQGGGAPWFYALVAIALLLLLFVRPAADELRGIGSWIGQRLKRRPTPAGATANGNGAEPDGTSTATTALLMLLAGSLFPAISAAATNDFEAADSIKQQWQMTHQAMRLTAQGTITLTGQAGDRFLLLRAPAILTRFDGEGLRLSKQVTTDQGLAYIINIPLTEASSDENTSVADDDSNSAEPQRFQATFEYQLESISPTNGIPVLTGTAAVQEIDLSYDEAGWDVVCPTAVRVEPSDRDDASTQSKVLLGPGEASVSLKPKARDVSTEQTRFFVETSNFFLPSPGVIDGYHRLHIRTAQGQLGDLNVRVPQGLTVSAVSGPVGSWQFDAESGQLNVEVVPVQSQPFDILIDTQRGLDPLPASVTLAPLKVDGADDDVGLVAIAFGPDAQPDGLESKGMSPVNLGDFDTSFIQTRGLNLPGTPAPGQSAETEKRESQVTLHRVYRYGADAGELTLQVASVEPEIRVTSKQVLSLGDERIVLAVNFVAEITRSGLFQLSFSLPEGLEIESLTGSALHHWAELSEGGQRNVILHFNGKTIGTQDFSLTLSGAAPTNADPWNIPRFELNEASRQTGELVVRPTTGIRLQTLSRQNVTETDPRSLGGNAQGALAFRLLQRDWDLVLGIEKLEPWLVGQVLHELTIREGQTRSALIADFEVQNASIRSLQIALPISDVDEIKTLRAGGETVSDFVRTAPDSNIWEVQFKRRVIGNVLFRIEYERRGDRSEQNEFLTLASFPLARQLSYYYGIRAGGRLELSHPELRQGWQRVDWNSVPQTLREAGDGNAPALAFRVVSPPEPLNISIKRLSLAEALKLRVAEGSLTTVLSPTGNQLTSVDLTMEVIQRSSLRVGLPNDGELFSIFVNGESVNSIRLDGDANVWQFYILPGIDDRTANVRFVYSVSGDRLRHLKLTSPELNVPLENIQWNVVAPKGYELVDNDGNLELTGQSNQQEYDRTSYLSIIKGKRQVQARQASQLLEQANQLLQAGEQSKARRALSSVANQYALDAASNEDARVQLENLQTQQAVVGLNTRRQRLYLDNQPSETATADDQQLRDAAALNPILQHDELNFRPQQMSELLRGNTSEDNAILQQIAGRLVQHQHTTEPAPQAILISLPEEGSVYTFSRSVQVSENAPLELELDFGLQRRLRSWQLGLALALLAVITLAVAYATTKRLTAA